MWWWGWEFERRRVLVVWFCEMGGVSVSVSVCGGLSLYVLFISLVSLPLPANSK